MATAIAQLEEEEMENLPDDERPKVTLLYHFKNHLIIFLEKETKEGHQPALWLTTLALILHITILLQVRKVNQLQCLMLHH